VIKDIVSYLITLLEYITIFAVIVIGHDLKGWMLGFILGAILMSLYHVVVSYLLQKYYHH